jgi:hypothetical protein
MSEHDAVTFGDGDEEIELRPRCPQCGERGDFYLPAEALPAAGQTTSWEQRCFECDHVWVVEVYRDGPSTLRFMKSDVSQP